MNLGPIISSALMIVTCFIAYITATFMVEAISIANSEDIDRRTESLYGELAYASPIVQRETNLKDLNHKGSPFYVRQKIEIGVVAQRIAGNKTKNFIIVILVIYMYGALCLKYVSGAESLVQGISYTFWGNGDGFKNAMGGFDPYFLGIAVFGFFSIYFSFGNIENAKTLQMVTTILRFLVTILMCVGSIYYISEDGV